MSTPQTTNGRGSDGPQGPPAGVAPPHSIEAEHEEGLPRGGLRHGRSGGVRYCSLTIVLTLAVTPSAISTTTM